MVRIKMFTGLIRELAEVVSFKNGFLSLKAKHKAKIGDSIAVNGACLTVVKFNDTGFTVELSEETLSLINIKSLKNKVHIEPAMQLKDRLEGHIVQGHIDCLGEISKIENRGKTKDFYIKIPKNFIKFIIPKGSVTIDGVSLTVNEVFADSFRLTIIPHTIKNTIIKNYQIGSKVNVETDMFARYLYYLFNKEKNLTWDKVDNIMSMY